jgi:hypothetical protein
VTLARRLQLTLGEIARLNAEERGQIVENRDDADIVLTPETFNVETAEQWLDLAEPVQFQSKTSPAPR